MGLASDSSPIAKLAAELEILVDQLALDVAGSNRITAATAARIHALREQAEQLFGSTAQLVADL
jgi:hypothetical protein